MAQEWIKDLAETIKREAREAAESFGRQEHRSALITEKGKPFFTAFVICLENNVTEIKRSLQGDVTASETTFVTNSPTKVSLSRSRFPWFDAVISLQDPAIVLDYAKGPGTAVDPVIAHESDRRIQYFQFEVDNDDALTIQHAFDASPLSFGQPEDLARYVTELLFQPGDQATATG